MRESIFSFKGRKKDETMTRGPSVHAEAKTVGYQVRQSSLVNAWGAKGAQIVETNTVFFFGSITELLAPHVSQFFFKPPFRSSSLPAPWVVLGACFSFQEFELFADHNPNSYAAFVNPILDGRPRKTP